MTLVLEKFTVIPLIVGIAPILLAVLGGFVQKQANQFIQSKFREKAADREREANIFNESIKSAITRNDAEFFNDPALLKQAKQFGIDDSFPALAASLATKKSIDAGTLQDIQSKLARTGAETGISQQEAIGEQAAQVGATLQRGGFIGDFTPQELAFGFPQTPTGQVSAQVQQTQSTERIAEQRLDKEQQRLDEFIKNNAASRVLARQRLRIDQLISDRADVELFKNAVQVGENFDLSPSDGLIFAEVITGRRKKLPARIQRLAKAAGMNPETLRKTIADSREERDKGITTLRDLQDPEKELVNTEDPDKIKVFQGRVAEGNALIAVHFKKMIELGLLSREAAQSQFDKFAKISQFDFGEGLFNFDDPAQLLSIEQAKRLDPRFQRLTIDTFLTAESLDAVIGTDATGAPSVSSEVQAEIDRLTGGP